MKLYAGIDLHANNNYLAIIDENDTRVYKRKLSNQADVILAELEPFRADMSGVVVESTFNWYWLVDLLMDEGYRLHLANPTAIQKYKGLKHSDDNHDAFWLAHLLRLNILPEGYIYPKEDRPIRDLLRKRGHLVQLRTALINSLQGIISRNCGCSLSASKIKAIKHNHISPLLCGQDDLELSGTISKECIDFLTKKIREIEKTVKEKKKLRRSFFGLQTIPGVGLILALTIMLETGSICRFSKVGQYASYCRKVPSTWTSNNKKKGTGNTKNGNKYLAWAFSEAAEMSRRFNEPAKAFFNRKSIKTNRMVAHAALAHKLARASYYIMRDGVEFNSNKLFA
ncbi:MAG: IS110 family transposase [Desulfofustis sp.]|nr:IS110 family transposase [Desulfofustis sp.]